MLDIYRSNFEGVISLQRVNIEVMFNVLNCFLLRGSFTNFTKRKSVGLELIDNVIRSCSHPVICGRLCLSLKIIQQMGSYSKVL